jgi:hypothetical protein
MLPEVMPRGRGSMHEAEDLMPSAIGACSMVMPSVPEAYPRRAA